jgi:hypothetical protein
VISGFNLLKRLPQKFPGASADRSLRRYHLYARHWGATLSPSDARSSRIWRRSRRFLFVAFALGAAVPIVDFFAIMPIERTISSMPISFAGVGVREHIFRSC